MTLEDLLNFDCAHCGAPGARFGSYAGFLCEACNAALPKACDFCTRRPPAWRYPGRPFEWLGGISHVEADWLACERCARLIEARRFLALLDVAVKNILRKIPAARRERKEIRAMVAALHNAFREHREGTPYRIDH